MMRVPHLLAALALLAACATQGPTGTEIRAALTPAQLERAQVPLLLAEVPGVNLAATLVLMQSRDGVETWRTGESQTLSFRGGVLVATRGLGDDLMSAEVTGTLAALNGGPQEGYPRLLTYLDGEDRTLFRAMICSMSAPEPTMVEGIGTSYATRATVETCHTTGLSVTNRYWQDPDGTMRRAEQWVGPGLGMLVTERLTR